MKHQDLITAYLRSRQARLSDELSWVRARNARGVDVHPDDFEVADDMTHELVEVSLLLASLSPIPPTMH